MAFYSTFSDQLKKAQENKAFQLISGIIGIYFSYLLTGVVHQYMIKGKYTNNWTGAENQQFLWPSGFLIFPGIMVWILGQMINRSQINNSDRTYIPDKNAALCGLTVTISTLTYTYAIYITNYPIVMMFKSCNILSVILVGVLCSRVTDRQLKLGPKKIVVGVFVTIGIVIFKYFDPSPQSEKQTEFFGIFLLIVSMLADGFLPDFQAEIKTVYKPQPMEMMTAINKWVTFISIGYSIILWEVHSICAFLMSHYLFLFHMFLMGALALTGQMFVYRMIKQFKQHFVPFVITTRKVFTVALSIVFYSHPTNFLQVLGIIIVFGIVTYEFVSDLMGSQGSYVPVQKPNDLSLQTDHLNAQHHQEISLSDQLPGQNQEQKYKKRMSGQHAPSFLAVEEEPLNAGNSPEAKGQIIQIEESKE